MSETPRPTHEHTPIGHTLSASSWSGPSGGFRSHVSSVDIPTTSPPEVTTTNDPGIASRPPPGCSAFHASTDTHPGHSSWSRSGNVRPGETDTADAAGGPGINTVEPISTAATKNNNTHSPASCTTHGFTTHDPTRPDQR